MMLKKTLFSVLFLFVCVILLLSIVRLYDNENRTIECCDIQVADEAHYVGRFRRVDDLLRVVEILKLFDRDNYFYPESSMEKNRWDGIASDYGASKDPWIDGVVGVYVDALPFDPRENAKGTDQYLYKSDGVDYKLIARNPEDCDAVKREFPELIDPRRDCWAYGFWTDGAADW